MERHGVDQFDQNLGFLFGTVAGYKILGLLAQVNSEILLRVINDVVDQVVELEHQVLVSLVSLGLFNV